MASSSFTVSGSRGQVLTIFPFDRVSLGLGRAARLMAMRILLMPVCPAYRSPIYITGTTARGEGILGLAGPFTPPSRPPHPPPRPWRGGAALPVRHRRRG